MKFRFRMREYDFSARTHIMGILNVTPDSFSDGGLFLEADKAIQRGRQLEEEGADILDIGGESTRPGSEPVSEDDELRRIIPVVECLARELKIPISVDTYKSRVAKAALLAGAEIVNDISGLTFDPAMVHVVREHEATAVIMHILGTPRTMQQDPHYRNVVQEVFHFLQQQASRAVANGIRQVIIDPGIGFGKKLEHNLSLINGLGELARLGFPVLVGPSRKSFLGSILNLPANERIEGSAAAVTACVLRGAHIVRVHDVREMKRVVLVADALNHQQPAP